MNAVTAPNRFVTSRGRTLAYRSIGTGQPIVLCNRFRGNLDSWDPLFLDSLAAHGLRAITFDYTGLGLSTGTPTYDPAALAQDAHDLIHALDLGTVVLAGWSLGGIAAQIGLATYPELITSLILLGTVPPGPMVKMSEQIFYDLSTKPENDFEDEVALFFEPADPTSRQSARHSWERLTARTQHRSIPVPGPWAAAQIDSEPRNPVFSAPAVLDMLRTTHTPILHIAGDHDIMFPVENWYALNQQLPTLQLITYPRAGHGPHQQHPRASAAHIGAFLTSP
ncbi:alpha/beta fold hydrolase [Streptomyces sp. NPDC014861]|uniref:alpha/beta fold hydrolase n=1 Tax=Streptomyces sp. NPDC014861 TaxID=3364923 RepID=UPI003701BB82